MAGRFKIGKDKMDNIIIKNLEVFARHGVLPEENTIGQRFFVSCEISLDLRKAGKTDAMEDSVSYSDIAHLIKKTMEENIYKLIERCAERVAEEILKFDSRIVSVSVEIKKPSAPIGLPLDYPAVLIHRAWHEVYVALGSNLGESRAIIEQAVERLKQFENIKIDRVSTLIETKPYGVTDQPMFLNGAMRLYTLLTPYELLDVLHEVEKEAGRERKIHWGPRTLDLDILFYDDLITDDEVLCIPHHDMKKRDFVLKPMAEIAPYKVHPVYKKRMEEMLEDLSGGQKWER